MGVNKKSKQKESKFNKSTIIVFIIGLLLVLFSVGGLSYLTSKSAANRIYKLTGIVGPEGLFVQGLRLKFNREDVSCFGLVKFDCEIKNPILNIPSLNIDAFQADKLEIGTFSRNGLTIGKDIDTYAVFSNIKSHKDYNLTKDMTEEGKKLHSLIFPFDLKIKVKIKRFQNGEAKGYIAGEYSSNIGSASMSGNIITVLENSTVFVDKNLSITKNELNAVAEKQMAKGYHSILQDFEAKISNKALFELLYSSYEYYFAQGKTEQDKKMINAYSIGINSEEKASEETFKKELIKRIEELIPHYNEKTFTDYFKNIIYLMENKGNEVYISGKNKGTFTVEELLTVDELGTLNANQLKYFNISITNNGENK